MSAAPVLQIGKARRPILAGVNFVWHEATRSIPNPQER